MGWAWLIFNCQRVWTLCAVVAPHDEYRCSTAAQISSRRGHLLLQGLLPLCLLVVLSNISIASSTCKTNQREAALGILTRHTKCYRLLGEDGFYGQSHGYSWKFIWKQKMRKKKKSPSFCLEQLQLTTDILPFSFCLKKEKKLMPILI